MKKVKVYAPLRVYPEPQIVEFDVRDDSTPEEIENLIKKSIPDECYFGWECIYHGKEE